MCYSLWKYYYIILLDNLHVPSSPGMWEEPDSGPDSLVSCSFVDIQPFPTAATCAMSPKKCHARPGLKMRLNEFQRVHLKSTWYICLDPGTDPYVETAAVRFKCHAGSRHKVEIHSISDLPRSDWDILWFHLNPLTPFFFFLWWYSLFYWQTFTVTSVSLSCLPLHGFVLKVCWFLGAQGTWFNFVLSLYSLIKG